MTRGWDGFADDFETQQERWDRQYERQASLRAAADAANVARAYRQQLQEMRHQGEDDGAHHWSPVTRLKCPCGCMQAGADDSDDPLDILGRQIDSDPLSQYERGQARADIERRAWELESMRDLGIGGIGHEPGGY